MNEQQTFERIVAESVSDLGPLTPTDGAIERTLTSVDQKRQRPRWLALIKEPPMRTNNHLAVGSPTVRVVAIMAATILLALALAAAGMAGQRLLAADGAIIVATDGSGHHESIQEAVDAAADGDTILVRPGTYDESVLITESITIRGDGARDDIVIANSQEMPSSAFVDTPGLPYGLRLSGSDALIENLTLQGDASRVEIFGGAPILRDLHFDDIGLVYGVDPGNPSVPAGVHVQGGTSDLAEIADSQFTRSTLLIHSASSPQVRGNDFDIGAIYVDGVGSDPVITENTIVGAGSHHTVTAWGGARPEIRGNTITSDMAGIHVRDSGFPSNDTGSWPTIVENIVTDSRQGISIEDGAHADVVGNTLMRNGTGIVVSNSDVNIEGNAISAGRVGAFLAGASPSLKDNIIEGNEQGLYISSGTPMLEGNTVCGNTTNLIDERAEMPDTSSNEVCEDTPAG